MTSPRPRNHEGYDEEGDAAPGGSTVPAALRPGPGLEALKLAVHRPDDVADRVHAALFGDPLQRQAFVAAWSTTVRTRRLSPRHRRWRACCDA